MSTFNNITVSSLLSQAHRVRSDRYLSLNLIGLSRLMFLVDIYFQTHLTADFTVTLYKSIVLSPQYRIYFGQGNPPTILLPLS